MGKSSQTSNVRNTTTYGNTTTSNPYATAKTTNSGTTASFKEGTALNGIYNFVNNNIDTLLNDYMNPNLNSAANQASLNAFRTNLNKETYKNLENNIINPLSRRNMIRSSQATDLYKNLSENNSETIASYIDGLIADSQNRTAGMLNTLLNAYMNGYNVLSDMQNKSLATSQGNATSTSSSTSTYSPSVLSNIQQGTNAASGLFKLFKPGSQS